MEVIKENLIMRIIWGLIPVVIFLGLFFISGTPLWVGILAVLDGHLGGFVFIAPGFFICTLTILLTKPIWYRTFFDKSFVGLEATTKVQWDEDCIRFSGVYFDLKTSSENILSYRIPFGAPSENSMFAIIVKVSVGNAVRSLWIPVTMPEKIKFLNFLKSRVG